MAFMENIVISIELKQQLSGRYPQKSSNIKFFWIARVWRHEEENTESDQELEPVKTGRLFKRS